MSLVVLSSSFFEFVDVDVVDDASEVLLLLLLLLLFPFFEFVDVDVVIGFVVAFLSSFSCSKINWATFLPVSFGSVLSK